MLVYHPAFDLYACIFRVLNLLHEMKVPEIEVDRLRIWDFYLTFPGEARKITFPNDLHVLSTIFRSRPPNPYEDLIDPKKMFERMKTYQISALRCLASYGFVDSAPLTEGLVKLTGKAIPEQLLSEYQGASNEVKNIIKLVIGFRELSLGGQQGIKSRTGLISFKNDPI